MNPTTFKQHSVFEKLDQLKKVLQTKDAKYKLDFDNHSFLVEAINYISERLKVTIPILTPDSELNTIAQDIVNCSGQINAFLGNNNVGHLTNSINHMNACLTRARNLPLPMTKGNFDYSKSLLNFHKILKDKLQFLNEENKIIKNLSLSQKRDIEKTRQEINRLSNALIQKETEIKNINSTMQTDFKNFKSNSQQTLETDRKHFKEEFEKDQEKFRKDFDDQAEGLENSSVKIVSELKLKLKEARKLVNVIGNIGATGNFKLVASYHRKSANTWRIIAIFFMSLLTILMIYTIWEISTEDFDWLKSIVRIVAAAILSYPATYAAQESSKHRKQENYNRKIELELTAINPFIELFDDPKKQIIKEKLVDKYFGNNHDSLDLKDGKDDLDIPVSVYEKIVKIIGNVIK